MSPRLKQDLLTLRGEVFGGVTAAVVGLPVALAFGIASGLGAAAGIYGAVAVGFFAALFGGCRGLISGPTGSTTVAIAVIVSAHADSLGEAFTIVIMAGCIQILLGMLRVGRFVTYTPYSVISGFMTGVGVIIILVQTLPFLGAPVVAGGPVGTIRNWPEVVNYFEAGALIIAASTLAVAALWPAKFQRFLPSTLIALLVGTLLGVLWLTDVPTIGAVPTNLPSFLMPEISPGILVRAIEPALVIALVSSVDTLLTALVADAMTRTNHKADKELLAQGAGTVFAGFIRALPGAGATPSTVANIRAGGRSYVAGLLAVGILAVMVMLLGDYVARIPDAVLAAILVKVGWDTIDWRFVALMHRVHREHLLVMLLTFGLTVFLDLVTAVAVGMIAAAVTNARQFERLELDSVVSVPLLDYSFLGNGEADAQDGDDDAVDEDLFSARVGLVALRGSFTVASAAKLNNTIGADIREHEVVILDFSDTLYVDDSAALVVEQLIDTAMKNDVQCIIIGLQGIPETTLRALNVLRNVPPEHFQPNLEDAAKLARKLLSNTNA